MSVGPLPDPDAVRAGARRLAAVAAALDEGADAVARLGTGSWEGPAAAAARRRLAGFDHPQRSAAAALREVAGALVIHAAVLDEAVAALRRAQVLDDQWAAQRDQDLGPDRGLDGVGVLGPGRRPALLPPVPAAGPGPAVVESLRAGAWALVEESALRTARVVVQAAESAPHVERFVPPGAQIDGLGKAIARVPLPGAAASGHWVSGIAHDHGADIEVLRPWIDAHYGEEVGLLLSVGGMVPIIGGTASNLNAGLDVARGDVGGAAIDALGLIPVGGQVIKGVQVSARGARWLDRAGRLGRAEGKLSDVADAAQVAGELGSAATAALEPGAPQVPDRQSTGAPVTEYERAVALTTGGTTLPQAVGTDDLVQGLLTSTHARWTAVPGAFERRPAVRGAQPRRWFGRAEVEERGRLVTYGFEVTAAGALAGAPRALRSRPLPPDAGRNRRAGAPPVVVTTAG